MNGHTLVEQHRFLISFLILFLKVLGKFFLKIVNPIVSVFIFAVCFWAAVFEDGSFDIMNIFAGGIPTYFFAKGFFTSFLLFIAGYILLLLLEQKENVIVFYGNI